MIEIDIPGWGELRLHFLVTDYNGTLACDGILEKDLPLLLLLNYKGCDGTVRFPKLHQNAISYQGVSSIWRGVLK